jgi:hypothetical protein
MWVPDACAEGTGTQHTGSAGGEVSLEQFRAILVLFLSFWLRIQACRILTGLSEDTEVQETNRITHVIREQ